MKATLFVLVFTVLSVVMVSVVPDASAVLSREFREKLQKQYESGYIPDPQKNMSYEERLAIRKKQQKLEEDKLKRRQQPGQLSNPTYRQKDRSDYRERPCRDAYHDDPYERTYRYCQGFARVGSRDFRDCMQENRERTERRDRDHDRYDNDRYYHSERNGY